MHYLKAYVTLETLGCSPSIAQGVAEMGSEVPEHIRYQLGKMEVSESYWVLFAYNIFYIIDICLHHCRRRYQAWRPCWPHF